MRVVLTGAGGQLGGELARAKPADVDLVALSRAELDLARIDTLESTIAGLKPDVVLNVGAYTAVDRAEAEAAIAFAVNGEAVGRLASGAAQVGARFVQISTDFVFDGRASGPYEPDDATAPLSVYGRSKLEGERAARASMPTATIVRTSWLYSSRGRNFVTNMLRLMREREELRVVTDQVGSPTWGRSLAEALWSISARDDMAGTWHWCDMGRCSWHEFACAIQDEALSRGLLSARIPIRPVSSAEFPTDAQRPAMSALDAAATRQALGIEAMPWRVALGRMLDEMQRTRERGNHG